MASAGTLSVSILARTKKFRSSMRQVRKEMLVCLDGAVVMGIYIKSRAFRMSATCQKGVILLIPRMSALY